MTALTLSPSARFDRATDDDLAHEIRHGDANEGLRAVEQRFGKRLHRLVSRIVRDASVAEDVVQSTIETVYLKIHRYATGTSFRAWLFEIARNRALSTLRKRKLGPQPMPTQSTRSDAGDRDPFESIESRDNRRDPEASELMTRLDSSVAALPEKYSQVFRLCVQEGKSYDEAGRHLKIPNGTVAIRIMRARQRLYGMLKDDIGPLSRPPACLQRA